MWWRTLAVVTTLFVPLAFSVADERKPQYYDETIEVDRERLLGKWTYPPLYRDGEPFVTLSLRFAKDGSGVLEHRYGEETREQQFSYALVEVGPDRVIVMKGDAFPAGAVFTYRNLVEKLIFFVNAKATVPELGAEPRNVAGSWMRPGVYERLIDKPR